MQEAEHVSSLIGDIYDAAIDPALWTAALVRVRRFVGGSAAALFSKDATHKSLNVYYDDGGLDPHYKQLYFRRPGLTTAANGPPCARPCEGEIPCEEFLHLLTASSLMSYS